MKELMKAMHKYGKGFEYLRGKFPKLSNVKLKEGIFMDRNFVKSLMMIYLNTC
jgi:hypothetical protein